MMGENVTPPPDEVLQSARNEQRERRRGLLKVFFGAAPGVGKTYAMLQAARARRDEGTDVVIGWVETHGRRETEALLDGLERLAPRELSYRGRRLTEFDLDGALERRPAIVVVDELAHTNAPGSRHAKRWRDALELLDAGIEVWTTLNVQHLESLNDVVAQITGIVVRETVPDAALDEADEVELIDLPPNDLRKRLQEGKVYIPEMAEQAVENFFRTGNLLALRELALRRTAQRVEAQVQSWRSDHAIRQAWPTAERVLVSLGPSPHAERLVRAARQLAMSLRAELIAVHVETPLATRVSEADRDQLRRALQLADRLGAEVVSLAGEDAVQAIVDFSRQRGVTRIVVGRSPLRWWRAGTSLVERLMREASGIDLFVVSGEPVAGAGKRRGLRFERAPWSSYAASALFTALAGGISWLLSRLLVEPANLVMVFLLAVTYVAVRYGAGPSALSALLSVAMLDFFFVEPHLTFAVKDTQYVLTFLIMLGVGLLISRLAVRVRNQAETARERERHTALLYSLSHELARAAGTDEIVRHAARHIANLLGARVALFLPGPRGSLELRAAVEAAFADSANERAVAQWVQDHGRPESEPRPCPGAGPSTSRSRRIADRSASSASAPKRALASTRPDEANSRRSPIRSPLPSSARSSSRRRSMPRSRPRASGFARRCLLRSHTTCGHPWQRSGAPRPPSSNRAATPRHGSSSPSRFETSRSAWHGTSTSCSP